MSVRKAWCPTCRVTDYVDGRWACLWCGEVTLKRKARAGRPMQGSVSVKKLREAHVIYSEGGTLASAAAAVWDDTIGYASPRILAQRLPVCWGALGLPYRSISDAQILRRFGEPAFHRPEITVEAAVEASRRFFTLDEAAAHIGCSRTTLRRRLARA